MCCYHLAQFYQLVRPTTLQDEEGESCWTDWEGSRQPLYWSHFTESQLLIICRTKLSADKTILAALLEPRETMTSSAKPSFTSLVRPWTTYRGFADSSLSNPAWYYCILMNRSFWHVSLDQVNTFDSQRHSFSWDCDWILLFFHAKQGADMFATI